MARKYAIQQLNGAYVKIEGRAFTVYIANIAHQFFVHASEGVGSDDAVRAVSHVESGLRIAVVTSSQYAASLRDEIGAAKLAIHALIEKVGEQRVRSVLAGAPKL